MINIGSEIHFLKDGKALSDAVHEAVTTVWKVIKEHHQYQGDSFGKSVEDNVLELSYQSLLLPNGYLQRWP